MICQRWSTSKGGFQSVYFIHAGHVCKIGGGVILCCYQDAVSLGRCEVDHVCFCRFSVDAVDFNNAHRMAFYPEVLACKCTNVDDAEHVGLAWLNWSRKVLGIVEESCIRHRLCPGGIGDADELLHQVRHLIVVPV